MVASQNPMQELTDALGAQFPVFFPDGIEGQIQKETFQSKTFQAAGYEHLPGYPQGDRFLYKVWQPEGKITYVTVGRISTGNPYAVGHAAEGGIDLRPNMIVVYEYDGKETIIESNLMTQEKNRYQGELGNPVILLAVIRQSLGTMVLSK